MLGDGELDEGQVWEAVMTAAQHRLDNVCAIVDYNHVQLDGTTEEIKDMGDLVEKWHSFGWNTIELDGHDMPQVIKAYEMAAAFKGKPTVLIANTVKGKGVSFMENDFILSKLSEQTGMSKIEVDNLIWSFCADGFGEICTATPHCKNCPIRDWCKGC